MEALALQTYTPTVNLEDDTSYISVFEAKIIITRVKQIDTPVYFLQKCLDNGLFVKAYEKSIVRSNYQPVY